MQGSNKNMMILAGVIVVLIVAAAAFVVFQNNANSQANNVDDSSVALTTPTDTNESDSKESVGETRTYLLDAQNDSGQEGTVVLEQVGDKVQVTISLSNPNSTEEPVHIHTGSCPTPGAVLFPLEDVVNGSSVTLINSTMASLAEMVPLAINIHKSHSESSVYYACGDLIF